MPSLFRETVKSKIKGGSGRKEAYDAAQLAMGGSLNTRQQKKYDRAMGKVEKAATPSTGLGTKKQERLEVRQARKEKRSNL